MSWQSALACWYLRRQFRPQTLKPGINVERARELTSGRAWSPRVPGGWRLRESYGPDDRPLRGEWIERADDLTLSRSGPIVLYCHGGGYYFCSPRTHRSIVFGLATRANAPIFSVDYRLAPEHRFPAALDDATAAYRQLVADGTAPESIVIAGDSAGGGLALATLIALRDAGDPLPAGCLLFSPWTDLATIRTNDGLDPMFSGPAIGPAARLYLGETPATHPYASPLYADLQGLPPLFIMAGSTEVLLDDSQRVADKARAAGVDCEFEVWKKMPHVWPLFSPFIPEANRALDRAAAFVQRVTSGATKAAQPSRVTSIA
ncbi:Acetyl esterase [Paraburkholderia domus]|jgi:Esterase/lipase|uniref:Acetyl esterase n=1 Tax=Paraburkholderia domus TaxID=2793075 RepID=A0A9N8QWV4_9BURK|nr:alpha/beta hydrolase [Paraburkholderia domus]MBK5048110.1 alpha/beta hydrolase [Burkholderia sp. R-70006]MBK5063078.1 alpha/beta hydrolase [Burkholderia sp. R-70199]MBK5084386.1 alpha/beta hydrolase [Burkholderia sp. R-69927]MBK5122939.1 alpha/beta hydrolase [Burkholderia sp. R-69980]MBK5163427.1 alpha/beta hydrolase [Burkholderia sp. R-70211]MBK5180147.1 alpha/beta hydrolase [Burkholderia sp. R-69749]MCI0149484.1 alpha/beta hydrolase fold domain-containing protein [Paraburkholderia sedim